MSRCNGGRWYFYPLKLPRLPTLEFLPLSEEKPPYCRSLEGGRAWFEAHESEVETLGEGEDACGVPEKVYFCLKNMHRTYTQKANRFGFGLFL